MTSFCNLFHVFPVTWKVFPILFSLRPIVFCWDVASKIFELLVAFSVDHSWLYCIFPLKMEYVVHVRDTWLHVNKITYSGWCTLSVE